MKNLLSFLFLIAMLLGTSSFSYETLEVNRTELSTAGVQKNKRNTKAQETTTVQRLRNREAVGQRHVQPVSGAWYI